MIYVESLNNNFYKKCKRSQNILKNLSEDDRVEDFLIENYSNFDDLINDFVKNEIIFLFQECNGEINYIAYRGNEIEKVYICEDDNRDKYSKRELANLYEKAADLDESDYDIVITFSELGYIN